MTYRYRIVPDFLLGFLLIVSISLCQPSHCLLLQRQCRCHPVGDRVANSYILGLTLIILLSPGWRPVSGSKQLMTASMLLFAAAALGRQCRIPLLR